MANRIIKTSIFILLAGFSTILLHSCYNDNEDELYNFVQYSQCDTTNVTYAVVNQIILKSGCNGCHSAASPSGNVITENEAGLRASVGKNLWTRLNLPATDVLAMPPGGPQLSECDLSKMRVWIHQ